jgi:hypothetical protein
VKPRYITIQRDMLERGYDAVERALAAIRAGNTNQAAACLTEWLDDFATADDGYGVYRHKVSNDVLRDKLKAALELA